MTVVINPKLKTQLPLYSCPCMQISAHANYVGRSITSETEKHMQQLDDPTAIISWISGNARTLLLVALVGFHPSCRPCSACTQSLLSRCTQWESSGSLRSCTRHAPTRALALSLRNSCSETARCCAPFIWRVKRCRTVYKSETQTLSLRESLTFCFFHCYNTDLSGC